MKNIFVILLFSYVISVLPSILFGQTINLPIENKFKFGDHPEWARPDFDDHDWGYQQLSKSFTKDSSYAWYRIRITIPSSMKTNTGKGLKIRLGKIDDADQTFFNGNLVGETGSFPPNYVTQWEKQRVYIIPEKDIIWDKENLIAVRIYNLVGGMGMWEGPYNFEPFGWVDEVDVSHEIIETPQNGFIQTIRFQNKTANPFSGTIKYQVTGKDNSKVIFSETKQVQLAAKAGSVAEVKFSDFRARGQNVFKVGYLVSDNNSRMFLQYEQLFIATSELQIPVLGEVQPLVKDAIKNQFAPIPLQNERYSGYLNSRFTRNLQQRLLKVDEPGLLGSYMHRPGIHPWAGEHIGKYLETASNVWKLTHDSAIKKQMDRMMFVLINTQLVDGYLGTYTPDQYWTSWDVWSHKYNLHGLLAYYAATGYKPALESCRKMGDLLCKTFGKGPDRKDIILAGTHMGMAATSVLDAMVELYRFTADKKYLDFCYYLLDAWEQDNGPKVMSTILATGKVKKVGNGKAYEMLSNYVGLAKLYQVTGDVKMLKAVEMAWQDVVTNQLYITGTSSSHEYFQDDDYLPATAKDNMGEGCVTTTWLQLNMNLFDLTGDIKYLNQLERTVYNHLLGAENPQTGCVSYYTPLMDKKPYTCHITCCQSSVPRGIALVPYFTFGDINKVPTLLFYEAASYKENIIAPDKTTMEVTFNLSGQFPENGSMVLTINSSKQANFPVALRVPEWCTNFRASIGGKVYNGDANRFVTITRNWKPGDKVMIDFDMPVVKIPGGKSYPGMVAYQRGPQILAFEGSVNSPGLFAYFSNPNAGMEAGNMKLNPVPEVLPMTWVGKQAYAAEIGNGKEKLILVPFAEAGQTEGEVRVWLPIKQ